MLTHMRRSSNHDLIWFNQIFFWIGPFTIYFPNHTSKVCLCMCISVFLSVSIYLALCLSLISFSLSVSLCVSLLHSLFLPLSLSFYVSFLVCKVVCPSLNNIPDERMHWFWWCFCQIVTKCTDYHFWSWCQRSRLLWPKWYSKLWKKITSFDI